MFSKQPKPAQNIFATFVRQLIPGNLQKIAQSGHTEFSVPQQSVNSSCSFCVGTSFAFGLFRRARARERRDVDVVFFT